MLNILLIEPFYGGSHKLWMDGLIKNSGHNFKILSLKARNWKWRMHGAAITLAEMTNNLAFVPDQIICTDMMDVALYRSLLNFKCHLSLYFHESQLAYPWLKDHEDLRKGRNFHYSFINYTSALVADKVFFNSNYHKDSFIEELSPFLNMYPDHKNLDTIDQISNKSEVLYLGLDLDQGTNKLNVNTPCILWNHRWEYDKNPDLFFNSLIELKNEGVEFNLIILGEEPSRENKIAEKVRKFLQDRILHWGFVEDRLEYENLLDQCQIIPITSIQDFFGISLAESCSRGLYPIIPNRLAFPEIIPFREYYYEGDADFLILLRECIKEEKYKKRQEKLIDHLKQYSWGNKILEYEKKLFIDSEK